MLKILKKQLGTVHVGTQEDIFGFTVNLMKKIAEESSSSEVIWGLSGGSTPQAFFKWCAQNDAIDNFLKTRSIWSCSDERHAPLSSEQSNFGNAERLLLNDLSIPAENHLAWPTHLEPEACAASFNQTWDKRFGPERGFDICFLGMGDDCHTASLFPGCPLILKTNTNKFAATEWPGKGWRLTITNKGFSHCGVIIITVLGKNKASAIKSAFTAEYDPLKYPVHLLQNFAEKTHWLLDAEAASELI